MGTGFTTFVLAFRAEVRSRWCAAPRVPGRSYVTETETEAGQFGKPVRVTVSGSAERMKKVREG